MSDRKIIEYIPKESKPSSQSLVYVPKIKKYSQPIKTLRIIGEPDDITEFETVDDFNKYYSEHQDEFECPTLKLNKKFKIPGYTLTKPKGGELCLKKSTKNKSSDVEELQRKYKVLAEAVNQLSEELQAIVKHLSGE